ncbi:MAG: insulinase family protein [Ignavibacteriae bacterium]|nr:insulinase family protein [Ignavibacteriota bacterium]NOG97333.1 insulinase family protein [Ignavibacteriota bacterium]
MKVERKNKPYEREQITFHLPKIKKLETQNGLSIWFVNKTELPIVQIGLFVSAGSKFDPDDKKGLSYLTSMMLDEGAGNLTALQLDDEFEQMGTILKISADHDSMALNMLSLSENFERSFDLFSKIVLQPKFSEEDFLREQKKLIDKITQLSDEPSYLASAVFEKLMFEANAYAFPTVGYGEHIKNISTDDLKHFHKEYFVPSNCNLIVVGNIEEKDLLNKIDDVFSSWIDSKAAAKNFAEPKRGKLKAFIIDKPGAAQSEIRIGHITGKRDTETFFSKSLLNTILGGQFSSRINLNLREDKGYTYGANSSFSYNKLSGYFAVSTSVQSENTVPAVNEILKELKGIKRGIKKEEVEFAKSYLIKRFPSLFETYSQIATHLSSKILYSLPDDYYDTYIKKIEKTSIDDIMNAAKENIFPGDAAILIVGDKKMIEEDLKNKIGQDIIELDINGNKID